MRTITKLLTQSYEVLQVSWHVPDSKNIDLVLRIFRELVEPTILILEGLLEAGENGSDCRDSLLICSRSHSRCNMAQRVLQASHTDHAQ